MLGLTMRSSLSCSTCNRYSRNLRVGGIVYAGSMDGTLYALDLKSGDLKWKYKTKGTAVRCTWDARTITFTRFSSQTVRNRRQLRYEY